jgi:hypothetical protein
MMIRTLGAAIVLTMATGVASADSGSGGFSSNADHHFLRAPEFTPVAKATTPAVSAPEMDPAAGTAGLMLMLGTLAVLRGRRPTQR